MENATILAVIMQIALPMGNALSAEERGERPKQLSDLVG
jgi:hypothetical protein